MDAITLYNIRRDERQLQRYKQRKEQRSKQKIIDDYRARRDSRLDAEDIQWVTMHGKHVPIGANGEFMAGPLKGQKYEKGKKESGSASAGVAGKKFRGTEKNKIEGWRGRIRSGEDLEKDRQRQLGNAEKELKRAEEEYKFAHEFYTSNSYKGKMSERQAVNNVNFAKKRMSEAKDKIGYLNSSKYWDDMKAEYEEVSESSANKNTKDEIEKKIDNGKFDDAYDKYRKLDVIGSSTSGKQLNMQFRSTTKEEAKRNLVDYMKSKGYEVNEKDVEVVEDWDDTASRQGKRYSQQYAYASVDFDKIKSKGEAKKEPQKASNDKAKEAEDWLYDKWDFGDGGNPPKEMGLSEDEIVGEIKGHFKDIKDSDARLAAQAVVKRFEESEKAFKKAEKLKSDFDKYNKEINGIEPSNEKAGSKAEKDGDITKYRNDLSKKSLDSYEVQKRDEKKITPILQKVSDEIGAGMVGLPYSVKTASSVDNKIARKIEDALKKGKTITADEAFEMMTDNVRYTQVSDKNDLVDNVQKTIATLEKNGYSLYELDNKWFDESGKAIEAGYRGVHTLFKAPSGTIFELQFHTPRNAAAKEKGHKYYDQQKELKKAGIGEDDERWKELDRKMEEIYSIFEVPKGIEKLKNKKKGG